jgi:hypothetical protein
MSTTEYTNLTIIDCNRQHSIQERGGNDTNPAIFTNAIKPVHLKVGDKVSVQGAYISEVGAGGDTVELKGEETGKTRTITYTKETLKYPTFIDDRYSNASPALPLITGYQEIELDPVATLTYPVKDNETYISIQYYLNNSGDSGYLSLPRRFGSAEFATDETNWNASNWTEIDNASYGRPYHNPQANSFVLGDYFYYDTSTSATNTGFYKLKNDCSRFTLMKRGSPVIDGVGTTKLRRETIKDDGTKTDNDYPPIGFKLLESKYYIYKQPIKISIDKGFNSPNSIGETISQQLKEANEPVDFNVKFQNVIEPITQYVSTNTFKPQLCSSAGTFTSAQADEFYALFRDGSNNSKEECWKYYSNFYNIYDKRPEIREAGQRSNNYLGSNQRVKAIDYNDRATATVKTSLHFTPAILGQLRDLFKAQKLYPELFSDINAQRMRPAHNGVKMSVDNARYLHMNTPYCETRTDRLGNDNVEITTANSRTLPFFFYFDKTKEDIYTDGVNTEDLCYGFATQYYEGGQGFVELHPELLGGLYAGLFQTGEFAGFDSILEDTLFGYDYHFNAYGTACLLGHSGRLKADYPLINVWGLGDINLWKQQDHAGRNASRLETAEYMRYNYVGCNNPKFEYDIDTNRFYFSDLHTPEIAGQEWISAGDNGSGVDPSIGDNTENGGDIVYKINKRINPYTYTPDMKPYVYEMDITYNYGNNNTKREISQPNMNIQAWSIFDSQSGIFIGDFGYDKETWDNGLWGILGFTYEQFNRTLDSTNNRNSRIVNANINNLNIPTTNSEIVSTDTRDYIVNQFGAVYYTTQLPSTSTLKHLDFLPAITQKTASIKLSAQNLPRKMLRPYYCIRSDIVDKPHYIGGDNNINELPVVAVANKQYSSNDFVFSSEEDFQFTITKDKTITSITTSIHDPDQSFSNVNKDTAVIYKIQSQVVNDVDLAQELLKSLKK